MPDLEVVRARRPALVTALALLAGTAGTALLLGLAVGGSAPTASLPGLPDAGPVTGWGLPLVRLLATLTATATIGGLLAAAALVPSTRDTLSTGALRASRLAGWFALTWSVAALLVLLLSLSDTLAIPLSAALDVDLVTSYVTQVDQGTAWAVTTLLAGVAAVVARTTTRTLGAWVALVVAVLAALPPALTGHSAGSLNHDLAVSSVVVHIVAVTLWVGGLLALWWYAVADGRFLPVAASRFSAMAVWAYTGVGISGVAAASVRLESPADLVSTGYGSLVVAKATLFVALGVVGWWHRQRTLPALAEGAPYAFARFAGVEALVMVTAMGLATALSRTPPPVPDDVELPTPAETLLGFAPPGPPSWELYLTLWRPDVLILLTLLGATVAYLRGVHLLRARGDRWPVGRTIGWLAGIAVAVVATSSGLAVFGRLTFSAHMTQHMLLGMVVPLLLVLGAPMTLALRVLPAAGPSRPAGPREWLLAVLQSRVLAVLTHPVVALLLFVTAPYMVYFSGLFELAMNQHWAHLAMHVHFVGVGYLFYETLVGVDPLPRRASYPMRLVALFLSLPFHAFFAVALMASSSVIAAEYYETLALPWMTDLLADQTGGSAFAWGFGEVPAIIALVVLLVQWSRDDDRRARREDRQADRDGDAELAAYNAMLHDRARPGPG